MARRPDGNAPRDVTWNIRLTKTGSEAADEVRGPLTRSAYVRRLIQQDVKKHQERNNRA